MKKIKFLLYLITMALTILAFDDTHIVKELSYINYESAGEEIATEPSKNKEEKKFEEINTEIQAGTTLEETKKESVSLNKEEKTENKTTNVPQKTQEKPSQTQNETTSINPSRNTEANQSSMPSKNTQTDYINQIMSNNDSLGTLGRLYIPSVNLNVGVNYAQAFGGATYNAQEIVDKKDSAAYYKGAGKYTIADHNYQGFDKINNVQIGDKAYIKKTDGTIMVLVAKNKFIGKNLKSNLVDNKGNSVYEMSCDIIMYTCYKNSTTTIMITLWDIE